MHPGTVREMEKTRLRRDAEIIFERYVLNNYDDYDRMKSIGGTGYADLYLNMCYNELKMINQADNYVYGLLVDIDSKLGMASSLQLFRCLLQTTRWDLIKV